jgi:hypothetical protein
MTRAVWLLILAGAFVIGLVVGLNWNSPAAMSTTATAQAGEGGPPAGIAA